MSDPTTQQPTATGQPIPLERSDPRRAVSGRGVLASANAEGVLEAADVLVAQRLADLVAEPEELPQLALAFAVRALRTGSVCLDVGELAGPERQVMLAAMPQPQRWLDAVAASALAAVGVLRVEHGLIYLDRYWRQERLVADILLARIRAGAPVVDESALSVAADRIFPGSGSAEARAAGLAAAGRWTTLVTGGPGTGKTTAVAGLLALLAADQPSSGRRGLRIALSAPTGKAAARLQEAVAAASERLPAPDRERLGQLEATTMHRLLGWRPGGARFRHDRTNHLPYDVVVVDETSMVSLTMMARLMEALRPATRLVLVGDPDQLSPVEAGAVLADLVAGLGEVDPAAVCALSTTHRFGGRIGALAAAIRDGDADAALAVLAGGDERVARLDPADPATAIAVRERTLGAALALRGAAEAGDADAALEALDAHRLLCAHRDGPSGAGYWNRQIERWLAELGSGAPGSGALGSGWGPQWYAGRPVLITRNDVTLGLANGDTGIVVRDPEAPDGLRVAISGARVGASRMSLSPSRIGEVETMHALTVHKSQGSQAAAVTVILPEQDSPLLTRELLYTAVTRASERVGIVATEAVLRQAIARPARRASGLPQRLRGHSAGQRRSG